MLARNRLLVLAKSTRPASLLTNVDSPCQSEVPPIPVPSQNGEPQRPFLWQVYQAASMRPEHPLTTLQKALKKIRLAHTYPRENLLASRAARMAEVQTARSSSLC